MIAYHTRRITAWRARTLQPAVYLTPVSLIQITEGSISLWPLPELLDIRLADSTDEERVVFVLPDARVEVRLRTARDWDRLAAFHSDAVARWNRALRTGDWNEHERHDDLRGERIPRSGAAPPRRRLLFDRRTARVFAFSFAGMGLAFALAVFLNRGRAPGTRNRPCGGGGGEHQRRALRSRAGSWGRPRRGRACASRDCPLDGWTPVALPLQSDGRRRGYVRSDLLREGRGMADALGALYPEEFGSRPSSTP